MHLQLARRTALLVPALLLAGAYVSQYGFGLYPCQMCWWQRYAHFAALGLAALAWLPGAARVMTALAALAIMVSGAIGLFHAGVEYQWWPGFTTCAATGAGSGDPLADILATPVVRCDVAPWTLFGISLAGFNFLFSAAAALAIAVMVKRGRREGEVGSGVMRHD